MRVSSIYVPVEVVEATTRVPIILSSSSEKIAIIVYATVLLCITVRYVNKLATHYCVQYQTME